MARIEGGVNLKWGTATKIARRRKLSANHVRLVALGQRDGSKGLVAAILREFMKQQPGEPLDTTLGAQSPKCSEPRVA